MRYKAYSAGQTVPSTAQIRAEGNNTKCVGKKRFNGFGKSMCYILPPSHFSITARFCLRPYHFAIWLPLSNICHVTSRKLRLPQCIMGDDLHIWSYHVQNERGGECNTCSFRSQSLHQSFFYSFITILPSESGVTLDYSMILPYRHCIMSYDLNESLTALWLGYLSLASKTCS
jgi:hypothetical protein